MGTMAESFELRFQLYRWQLSDQYSLKHKREHWSSPNSVINTILIFILSDSSWQTCVKDYQLMPNPHCETASHDYFTISREQVRTFLCNRQLLMRKQSDLMRNSQNSGEN